MGGAAAFFLCSWVNKHLQNKVHSLFILCDAQRNRNCFSWQKACILLYYLCFIIINLRWWFINPVCLCDGYDDGQAYVLLVEILRKFCQPSPPPHNKVIKYPINGVIETNVCFPKQTSLISFFFCIFSAGRTPQLIWERLCLLSKQRGAEAVLMPLHINEAENQEGQEWCCRVVMVHWLRAEGAAHDTVAYQRPRFTPSNCFWEWASSTAPQRRVRIWNLTFSNLIKSDEKKTSSSYDPPPTPNGMTAKVFLNDIISKDNESKGTIVSLLSYDAERKRKCMSFFFFFF